jgi:hypothetical protein
MDIQPLPLVPFGKYKDKSVTELLADKNYVDWLKKQSWFSEKSPIYNIVVNQTINTTNNSKTPEHNKLQNLFLDENNQQKLLSKLFNKEVNSKIDKINNILQNEVIIRCFGINNIPEFSINLDNTIIKFEYKFNWDLYLHHRDQKVIELISNLEIEQIDKIKYKEQYDIKENEKYNNNLLLLDRFIEELSKFNEEIANMSVDEEQVKNIVNKYPAYIHAHVSWGERIGDKYKESLKQERERIYRNLIYKTWENNTKINELFENCKVNFRDKLYRYGYKYSINDIYKIKKEYENDYAENYENNFNKHYEKYRLQYYEDILKNYKDSYIRVEKSNKIQYCLIIYIYDINTSVCCELKPTLSDDYPCVLRKLQTQIEPIYNYKERNKFNSNEVLFRGSPRPILLIESFTSKYTSKKQLIAIFKQHKIQVIFTNEIFETSNSLEIESVNTNKLIEENKFLTDNLLETQQKLLQSEEKIKYLEEKILS